LRDLTPIGKYTAIYSNFLKNIFLLYFSYFRFITILRTGSGYVGWITELTGLELVPLPMPARFDESSLVSSWEIEVCLTGLSRGRQPAWITEESHHSLQDFYVKKLLRLFCYFASTFLLQNTCFSILLRLFCFITLFRYFVYT
jgi:hypothetical protein